MGGWVLGRFLQAAGSDDAPGHRATVPPRSNAVSILRPEARARGQVACIPRARDAPWHAIHAVVVGQAAVVRAHAHRAV